MLRQTTSQRLVTTQSRFPSTSGEQQMPLLGIVETPAASFSQESCHWNRPSLCRKQSRQPRSTFGRVLLEPAGAVVGGAEDPAVGHHRRAVGWSSRAGQPSGCSWPSRPTSGPTSGSNFPTFHSTGMFLPSGVLFRAGEPPHCGQSAAAANTKTSHRRSAGARVGALVSWQWQWLVVSSASRLLSTRSNQRLRRTPAT